MKKIWDRKRTLVLGLVIPLLLLSIFFLFLSHPESYKDVFFNLATDFITIIVTVFYVDWVLRQHDEAAWEQAEEYIAGEASVIANAFIRDLAYHLHLEDEIFPAIKTTDIQEIQSATLARVRDLDRFVIEDALAVMTKKRWEALISMVDTRITDSSPVLSQFASKMNPIQLGSILRYRKKCSLIVSAYSIFQSFLGVPIADLPKVKDGKPEEYTVLAIIRLGIDFREALDACLEIIDAFKFEIGPIPDDTEKTQASWDRWRARGGNMPKPSS